MTSAPQLLRAWWRTIALLAAVAAAVTAIVTLRLPPSVDVAQTFTIPIPDRPASGEYEFDGFYAIQATERFADTLAGWLSSPDLVADVYRRAELAAPASTVRRLGRVFTTRRLFGQVVEVQFRTADEKSARALLAAITEVVGDRTDTFNQGRQQRLVFHVVPEQPLLLPVLRSASLRALVAAFVIIVVSASLLLFWDAWRAESSLSL